MRFTKHLSKKTGLAGALLFGVLSLKAQVVTYTASVGSINSWTVPCGVTSFTVAISGAAGGGSNSYTKGGDGVSFTQVITTGFSPGDLLKLAPGNAGTSTADAGGGGGGSFVYDATSSTLLAAAGGGGGGGYKSGYNGYAASLTTAGVAAYPTYGGAAGINETGGGGGTYSDDNGAGGAGWLANGGAGGTNGGTGGNDYANGLGGVSGYDGASGGFGGGGGGGYNGGGGGGGYNGGGGGSGYGGYNGGGGGSGYWNGSFINASSPTATNTGNGSIVISYIHPIAVVSNSATGASCFNGNNGTTKVTLSGGSIPYTYLWNPGGNTNGLATGLTAGAYTITATDQGGCTATASVAVTQPLTQVTATISSQTNILCNGGNNGSAAVAASGGVSAYTYSWSPSNETNDTATGLSAGCYTVTATDGNGCSATVTTCLIQLFNLAPGIHTVSEVSCSGGSNGSLVANPFGGIAPYTYLWNNGKTSNNLTGLTAGSYSITVTDSNGCTGTSSVVITQPNQLATTMGAPKNVSCMGGDNGSATVSSVGGTLPYTYSWSPAGGSSGTATGLTAGNYTVTVTDFNKCTSAASVSITQPATAIAITGNVTTDVTCNGESTGSASSSASGGTGPYTYLWSNAKSNSNATGLSAGTYTIGVSDANGCTASTSVGITQPAALAVVTDSVSTTSNTSCNGKATATVSGGVSPYTYMWNPGGETTPTITGQCGGKYCCAITDANGCTHSVCVSVGSTTGIANVTSGSEGIRIYPNPNNGQFTLLIASGTKQSQSIVEVYNVLGEKVYSQFSIFASPLSINLSNQSNGIYLYRVISENGNLLGEGKIMIQK